MSFSPAPTAGEGNRYTPPVSVLEQSTNSDKIMQLTGKLPENSDKPLILENMQGRHGGQCVEFVKNYLRMEKNQFFKGNAIEIKANANYPEIGWVVMTTEGYYGHVAVITDIKDDYLVLAESNYNNDEIITVGRELLLDSPLIRGFFAVEDNLDKLF